jgi:hypothetical protein
MHSLFKFAELLENCLEVLQDEDMLLGAMSTSRFWKECIKGSVKPRRICFQMQYLATAEEKHAGEPKNPEIAAVVTRYRMASCKVESN